MTAPALSHLQWRFKKARADMADRLGRGFTYVHPTIGRFVYHPSDWISRRLFLYGDFEAPEMQFARERASVGGLVLDVGANVGVYATACARVVGAGGRVIAVEPGPETFAKLRDTCAWLGLSNVETVHAAAGPTNGTARFVIKPDHDVLQHLVDARADAPDDAIEVRMVRLDDLCAENAGAVVLMKMDVEGHEVGALAGAEKILANGRAALIVEFLPSGLAAAGASADHLWSLLARTHRCTGIFQQDGASLAPDQATIGLLSGDESFNTCWLPAAIRSAA